MLLAIDTSGSNTSVVVWSSPANTNPASSQVSLENSSYYCEQSSDSHSTSLSLLLKSVLKSSQLEMKDIKAIILGSGPGSFTGLRIGFAFAKGLALGVSPAIPIITISSLAAAAWQFRKQAFRILALDDARRQEFFVADFSQTRNGFRQELNPTIFTREEILAWKAQNADGLIVSANHQIVNQFEGAELASKLALSLAEKAICEGQVGEGFIPYNSQQVISKISEVAPVYVRKVAALTIEERKVD